ncbi:disheveled-associated activator of morphogenesis 1-like [Hydractinia symbiolongicarpus]|uniref:disheveled-associated activator of morphogenesis 1-like n=1 Tax=Hydractinia symbiolongicarpus TaxID=13093 RepID=UPI00254DD9EE|nr:disheveled-associated activator of morphogenesis 1-like [Hydractinia symbiolongicarpus]
MAFDKTIAALFSKKKTRKRKKNNSRPSSRASATYSLEDRSSDASCSDISQDDIEVTPVVIVDENASQADFATDASEDNSVNAFSEDSQVLVRNRLIRNVDYVDGQDLDAENELIDDGHDDDDYAVKYKHNDDSESEDNDDVSVTQLYMGSSRYFLKTNARYANESKERDREDKEATAEMKKFSLMTKLKNRMKKLSNEEKVKQKKEKGWVQREMREAEKIKKERRAVLKRLNKRDEKERKEQERLRNLNRSSCSRNQVISTHSTSSSIREVYSPVKIFSIPRWRLRHVSPLIGVVQSMITEEQCQGLLPEQCFPPPPKPEPKWVPPKRTPQPTPTPPPTPPPISPGLPSSVTSSWIDFNTLRPDTRSRELKAAAKRRLYGFDIYGNSLWVDPLPEGIEYCYIENGIDGPEIIRRLSQYRSDCDYRDRLEEEKKRAEENPPENPDDLIEYNRETAERYMRDACEGKVKEEYEEDKKRKNMEFRIRRRIAEGSYPNASVNEEDLPSLLRYVWKGKLKKVEKYLADKHNHDKINKRDHRGSLTTHNYDSTFFLSDYLRRSALHYAASWGCCRIMKMLLEVPGISLNRRDEDGKTPLYKVLN